MGAEKQKPTTLATYSSQQMDKVWALTEQKYGSISTIEQAIDSESWTLNKISLKYSERECLNLIAVMIGKLNKAAGITNKLSKEQVRFVATNILTDYKTLKMADIVLFFNRLIKGEYGELYNNLSTDKIFSNLKSYM